MQLDGEAEGVIEGLDIINQNYEVAVAVLKDRYEKTSLMIDAHYSQLRDLPMATGNYSKLRATLDTIEKHLRSLEALGENVNNNMVVSLLKSKLPKSVIARLEEAKDDDLPWDLEMLRKGLKKLVAAQEAAERQISLNGQQLSLDAKGKGTPEIQRRSSNNRSGTGVLHVGAKQRSCFHCDGNH